MEMLLLSQALRGTSQRAAVIVHVKHPTYLGLVTGAWIVVFGHINHACAMKM